MGSHPVDSPAGADASTRSPLQTPMDGRLVCRSSGGANLYRGGSHTCILEGMDGRHMSGAVGAVSGPPGQCGGTGVVWGRRGSVGAPGRFQGRRGNVGAPGRFQERRGSVGAPGRFQGRRGSVGTPSARTEGRRLALLHLNPSIIPGDSLSLTLLPTGGSRRVIQSWPPRRNRGSQTFFTSPLPKPTGCS